MKKISEIVTRVIDIAYSEEQDCYKATITDTVLTSVWNGFDIIYKELSSIFLIFGTVNLCDIEVGDAITIATYEHEAGETVKLSHDDEHTFMFRGYHNVVTGISKPQTLGKYMEKLLTQYNLNDCVIEKNINYNWCRFNRLTNSTDASNFANFVANIGLVEIKGNKDGSITCWF